LSVCLSPANNIEYISKEHGRHLVKHGVSITGYANAKDNKYLFCNYYSLYFLLTHIFVVNYRSNLRIVAL